MIANLKLGPKLIGGFGSVLALFICVMFLYHYSVKYSLTSFNDLMETEQAISDHAGQMENFILKARIEERNFLESKDYAYQKKLLSYVGQVVEESHAIETLAGESNDKEVLENVDKIITLIGSYRDDFNQVVEAITTRGINDNSGLREKFNKSVTTFMDNMSLLEVQDYYIEILRLQKLQADYLLYKTEDYSKKIHQSLDTLKSLATIENSNPIRDILNSMVLEMIPDYNASFGNLRKKGADIGIDDKDFKMMKSSLAEISETLNFSYFSGARAYALDIRKNEKDYMLTGDAKYVDATKNSIRRILDAFAQSTVQEDYSDLAKDNLAEYVKAFDTLVSVDQKIGELKEHMRVSVNTIIPLVDEMNNKALAVSVKKRHDTEVLIKKRVNLAFVIGIGAIFLGMALAIIITRGITQPIIATVSFAEGMARGDLAQQLLVNRKDEVGILAKALNGMVANLNGMFMGISKGVDELTLSSSALSTISGEMLQGAEKTSEKSNFVSQASGKMNETISRAAATVQESAANMSFIAKTTEEMNLTIGEISRSTEEARKISDAAVIQADSATQKIGELERAALDIGKVTDTIRDISEQTNLLALNATIESARAGEAGKGFAVVAGEIKTLAQQTAQATKEISSRIEGVQGISRETMAEIKEITGVINSINNIVVSISSAVTEQSQTTREMTENITRSSEGIQDINKIMTENSAVTSEIVEDITEVSRAAEDMNKSSLKVTQSSEDLMKLAGRLKEMVNRFTL
ncbi:MAG: methyl-accepting chemotaxis protein [Proteobacteria bacterium]|nr:methyl-accepting chemotaxis protein [Pseudomonadota bacterium]